MTTVEAGMVFNKTTYTQTHNQAYSPLQPQLSSLKNTQSAMDPFNPADSVYDGGEKWVANHG